MFVGERRMSICHCTKPENANALLNADGCGVYGNSGNILKDFFEFRLTLHLLINIEMEYSKIIAVTGLPGLFELLSSKSDGAIVRSLDDKSSRFVSSRIHQFSHLETIEVYAKKENVNLVDVFKEMDKSKEKLPDEKNGDAVKKYFEKVFPDLDHEKVYSSDMKKMVKWFSALKAHDVEFKLTEMPEDEEKSGDDKPAEKKIRKPVTKTMEKPMRTGAAHKKTTHTRKMGD